jgi:NAD-dependent dihydropyrimidine dehydrogenase PreA subunit
MKVKEREKEREREREREREKEREEYENSLYMTREQKIDCVLCVRMCGNMR